MQPNQMHHLQITEFSCVPQCKEKEMSNVKKEKEMEKNLRYSVNSIVGMHDTVNSSHTPRHARDQNIIILWLSLFVYNHFNLHLRRMTNEQTLSLSFIHPIIFFY